MKKLISYIFFLLVLISAAIICRELISFTKDIILLNPIQNRANIRAQRMLHPVVKITNIISNPTDPEGQPTFASSATGFSVEYSPELDITFIITNDHFCKEIQPGSSLVFENFKNKTIDSLGMESESRVLRTDPKLDLCLVYLRGYVRPAEIADYNHDPMRFEEVFIVGGPSGDFPIIIDTYISNFLRRGSINMGGMSKGGNPFILTSEQIFPGHSGSPVYTIYGEVIGVVFGALPTYGGISVSHRDIYLLLDEYYESLNQNNP